MAGANTSAPAMDNRKRMIVMFIDVPGIRTAKRWDEVALKTRAGPRPLPLLDGGEIAGVLSAGR
jgi:hypothetical protein